MGTAAFSVRNVVPGHTNLLTSSLAHNNLSCCPLKNKLNKNILKYPLPLFYRTLLFPWLPPRSICPTAIPIPTPTSHSWWDQWVLPLSVPNAIAEALIKRKSIKNDIKNGRNSPQNRGMRSREDCKLHNKGTKQIPQITLWKSEGTYQPKEYQGNFFKSSLLFYLLGFIWSVLSYSL